MNKANVWVLWGVPAFDKDFSEMPKRRSIIIKFQLHQSPKLLNHGFPMIAQNVSRSPRSPRKNSVLFRRPRCPDRLWIFCWCFHIIARTLFQVIGRLIRAIGGILWKPVLRHNYQAAKFSTRHTLSLKSSPMKRTFPSDRLLIDISVSSISSPAFFNSSSSSCQKKVFRNVLCQVLG